MTAFTTVLNGTFLLLIPAGMFLCRASADGWSVLVDFIFYILFAPMCSLMMTRVMYAGSALMQVKEAAKKMDEIMSTPPLKEAKQPKNVKRSDVEFKHVTLSLIHISEPTRP